MTKYIKNYLTVSAATEATDILSPNVTYVRDKEKVLMANVGDNKELEIVLDGSGEPQIQEKLKYDYLTFTCLEDGGISMSHFNTNTGTTKPSIEYSLNGGEWTTWTGDTASVFNNIPLVAGDVVKMKGINTNGIGCTSGSSWWPTYNYSKFTMTGKIAASGNIMSLIDGEKDGTKVIPGTGCCFYNLFRGCTSLTTAPELPATTLATYCYQYMFYGCTSLNYIKAMFTTTPSTTYTENWVSGVAASGTFVKNKNATWSVTGVNGIPSGWTVETA